MSNAKQIEEAARALDAAVTRLSHAITFAPGDVDGARTGAYCAQDALRAAISAPTAGGGEKCRLCGGGRSTRRLVNAVNPGVLEGEGKYGVACPAVFHAPPDPLAADSNACPASEPSATDDAVVANLRAMCDLKPHLPTWSDVRYLLAHIDGLRGYAETGEDVEGILIKANLDDFEQTPGETVLWLIDRICSAETALFLGAHAEGMATSAVGECARAHFKKYPDGIHKKGGES